MNGDGGNADLVDMGTLYRHRFSAEDLEFKRNMWEVLCRCFFQRYVRATDTVLDLGTGTCEFINAIRCGDKIVVDLNPDVALHARDATVVLAPATAMAPIASGSVDVAFCSNFFEHLPHKTAVLQTLGECRRVMRPGGTLIILQPNIRYLSGRYWDYFDHHLAFTHVSMVEALALRGFVARKVIPRFLPYTVKNTRLPRSTVLLRAYLRMPLLWPLLGRQMLIIAEREVTAET
jgi:SAM-dependent methyltransferase